MILLVDNEGPDQTAPMRSRSLIWVFGVHIWLSDTYFLGA